MTASVDQNNPGTILFTGGGTAGHVLPCIPLIENFQQLNWQTLFVGSRSGLEAELLAASGAEFVAISSGKLRRYYSWQNVFDVFRIAAGMVQAFRLLGRKKPNVVFSKGGFVSFPVVFSAWLRGIPVVAHESDTTAGLANRLVAPLISVLCTTFEATKTSAARVIRTGTPIRRSLVQGTAAAGRALCGASARDRLLLVVGGSLGAESINHTLRKALGVLSQRYFVVHVCGRGHLDGTLKNLPRYRQYEFVGESWGDLLAAADIVLSRAGANALYELLVLEKLHVLVPLSARASRGDQIKNAYMSAAAGYSIVIEEDDLTADRLVSALERVEDEGDQVRGRLADFPKLDSAKLITDILLQIAGK